MKKIIDREIIDTCRRLKVDLHVTCTWVCRCLPYLTFALPYRLLTVCYTFPIPVSTPTGVTVCTVASIPYPFLLWHDGMYCRVIFRRPTPPSKFNWSSFDGWVRGTGWYACTYYHPNSVAILTSISPHFYSVSMSISRLSSPLTRWSVLSCLLDFTWLDFILNLIVLLIRQYVLLYLPFVVLLLPPNSIPV